MSRGESMLDNLALDDALGCWHTRQRQNILTIATINLVNADSFLVSILWVTEAICDCVHWLWV